MSLAFTSVKIHGNFANGLAVYTEEVVMTITIFVTTATELPEYEALEDGDCVLRATDDGRYVLYYKECRQVDDEVVSGRDTDITMDAVLDKATRLQLKRFFIMKDTYMLYFAAAARRFSVVQ